MLELRCFFLCSLFFSMPAEAESTCAKNYQQLENSTALKMLKSIIDQNKPSGFVNKTEGSYFYISTNEHQDFQITFYTTGFLDLYGIQKTGPIVFCEENNRLTAVGLDRVQNIFIQNARLEFGKRSDRESFMRGPMPTKLATINKVDSQTLAAD